MVELSAITEGLKAKFGEAIGEASSFRDQDALAVDKDKIVEICTYLRDEPSFRFDMLTDQTAVDYMGRTPRFRMVYILYSFDNNQRFRLTADVDEGETIATVETVWLAANWFEREIYDLFGIVFEGHSDLRRILLWDGYIGHPLRKDFPLTGIKQTAVYR